MSYMTLYTLEHDVPEEEITELIAELEGLDVLGGADLAQGMSVRTVWHGHEWDLRYVSRAFPDNVFILTGEGEARSDMWKIRCRNDEVLEVRAEIFFPDFPPLS